MAQRWRVYKDHQDLGLMTSAEIRQALRDGVVDPFDLVSREGSSLKVELVEVDEIFDPRRQEAAEPVASPAVLKAQVQMAVNAPVPVPAPAPAPIAQNAPPAPAASQDAFDAFTFPMTGTGELTNTGRRRRAMQKKFYLVDRRGRVLGPLSAGEIQSLYQRGIVEKGVRVQKVGEPKSIPLNLFISAYAGERMQALGTSNSDIRSAPGVTAMKSSKVLNELYRNFTTGGAGRSAFAPYIGVILVGVFLGLLVFFSLNFDDQSPTRSRQRSVTRDRASVERPRRSAPTLRRIPERSRRQASREPRREQERRTPVESPLRRRDDFAPQRPNPQRAQRPVERREEPAPRAVASAPPPAVEDDRLPPPPTARAVAREALDLRDGAVATLRGVEFSKVEFEDCPLKCKLAFYQGGRRIVTAVFFRGAFEEKLLASRGAVTIRGTLKREGDGFLLFLQDIR